jgi:peroxiredoxin
MTVDAGKRQGRPVEGDPAYLAPGAGIQALEFNLHDTPHSRVALADLRGRAVVLAFYVADWHPVATDQLAQLTDLMPELDRMSASVLGVSIDGIWSHAAFARAVGAPFPLLADDDPPGAVARAYGLFVPESGRSRRALFVIDRNGVVAWCATFPDEVNPGVDGVLSALETIADTNRSAVAS